MKRGWSVGLVGLIALGACKEGPRQRALASFGVGAWNVDVSAALSDLRVMRDFVPRHQWTVAVRLYATHREGARLDLGPLWGTSKLDESAESTIRNQLAGLRADTCTDGEKFAFRLTSTGATNPPPPRFLGGYARGEHFLVQQEPIEATSCDAALATMPAFTAWLQRELTLPHRTLSPDEPRLTRWRHRDGANLAALWPIALGEPSLRALALRTGVFDPEMANLEYASTHDLPTTPNAARDGLLAALAKPAVASELLSSLSTVPAGERLAATDWRNDAWHDWTRRVANTLPIDPAVTRAAQAASEACRQTRDCSPYTDSILEAYRGRTSNPENKKPAPY